jgi:predicted metal-dependent hydrolase
MEAVTQCLEYGKEHFDYEVIFADRKSLEIAVHPDKSILVKAPLNTEVLEIQLRVSKRARWIRKQVHYFQQFDPRTPDRKYIIGETHLYLGRRYRLSFTESCQKKVLLKRGRIQVSGHSHDPQTIKKQVIDWYRSRATAHYQTIFDLAWERFKKYGHSKPSLQIRTMTSRWGSLSQSGTLTLNADLIKAPKECLEYVILHELCHLAHHDHSKQFYDLLEVCLPDWEKRKHKLELALI